MSQYEPAFNLNNVAICLSCDDDYFNYLTVTIQSIMQYSNKSFNYDILILHSNLSKILQQDFNHQIIPDNFSVRFIDIETIKQQHATNFNFPTSKYLSISAYYRIFMPLLFPSYDKIIYLDCDLVLNHDISELFLIDLSNDYLIAAVQDLGIISDAQQNKKMSSYINERLMLNDITNYVNSGVLLLNIKQMNKEKITSKFLDNLSSSVSDPFKFHDQDIINKVCAGRVYFLDPKWNVLSSLSFKNKYPQAKLTDKELTQFTHSFNDPYIIHYAGAEKPWKDPIAPLSFYFWQSARNTFVYERIVYNNCITPNVVFILFNYKKFKRKYTFYCLLSFFSKKDKYKKKKLEIQKKLMLINKIFKNMNYS